MDKLAKILIGFTISVLLFFLVVMLGTNVQAEVTLLQAEPAESDAALAQALLETAALGDMGSDLFKHPGSADLKDYRLINIRLEVRNWGVLPAEWMRLCASPGNGDVALFADNPRDLHPFGGFCEMTAVLLSETEAEEPLREIWVEYYCFGQLRQSIAR